MLPILVNAKVVLNPSPDNVSFCPVIVYIPDVIVGYRMHESNLSGNKALMFDEVYKILNRYKHQVGYAYAEYKVYKLYKIRPVRQESEMKYWALRIKYLSLYLSKLIFRF